MLRYVAELTALESPEEFRAGVLPGMRELVPCDIASYNEVEFDAGRMIAFDDPPGSMIPSAPATIRPARPPEPADPALSAQHGMAVRISGRT